MNTSKLFFLLSLSVFFTMCVKLKKNEFLITGEFKGMRDSTLLYLGCNEHQKMDSCMVINGKFKFKGTVTSFLKCGIYTKPARMERPEYIAIWLEPTHIKIKAKVGEKRNTEISGGKVQSEINIYLALTKKQELKLDSLDKILEKFNDNRSPKFKELAKMYNNIIMVDLTKISNKFIEDNPSFIFSSVLLSINMKNGQSRELTNKLFNKLSPNVKQTSFSKTIQEYLAIGTNLKVGDKAVDFQVETITREKINLFDFKNKYVLLEFWSSGCNGCRMEHPDLLQIYKAYNNKGFEIFGVSLDQSKKNMIQAIKEDHISWKNGSDWLGMSGNGVLIYNVNSIPSNFLINPEGVIIAKDLNLNALENKLKEIYSKNI